jgi:hypothetical protein
MLLVACLTLFFALWYKVFNKARGAKIGEKSLVSPWMNNEVHDNKKGKFLLESSILFSISHFFWIFVVDLDLFLPSRINLRPGGRKALAAFIPGRRHCLGKYFFLFGYFKE